MARVPRSKREIVDRILSIDFSGDIRSLDADPSKSRLRRVGNNKFQLEFSDGRLFVFTVSKPRTEAMMEEMRARKEARSTGMTEKIPKRKPGRPKRPSPGDGRPHLEADAPKRRPGRPRVQH